MNTNQQMWRMSQPSQTSRMSEWTSRHLWISHLSRTMCVKRTYVRYCLSWVQIAYAVYHS